MKVNGVILACLELMIMMIKNYHFDFHHAMMNFKLFIKTGHTFYLKIIVLQLKQIKSDH
jgi:hypothetical protein